MPTAEVSIKTSYDQIRSIKLVDFLNTSAERTFEASELWKDKSTIIIVIRRPGCQFCREEATALHSHRDIFENAMGLRMVCIVREKLGADEFQAEAWKGEVYFDPEGALYRALGGHGRLRVARWETLIRPSFWKHFMRNKRSGVRGNFVGDGSVLGGLLMVAKEGEGAAAAAAGNRGRIVYEHEEKVWGDIAPVDQVLQVASEWTGVKVDPEARQKAQAQFKAYRDKVDSGATCEQPSSSTKQ